MNLRRYLVLLVALVALPSWAQSSKFNKYTDNLTRLLETDALSVMVTGGTFETAQTLCKRLGGSLSHNVETEFSAWRERNGAYIRGAAQALNEFGDLYKAEGGDSAKQEYLQMLLRASANAATQRLSLQLKGHSVEGGAPPPESFCFGLAKWLRDGVSDLERTPDHIKALRPYIQRPMKK
ncbi:MAG: hypothetical protein ABIK82_00275 [Pseudomonadota bacterium]